MKEEEEQKEGDEEEKEGEEEKSRSKSRKRTSARTPTTSTRKHGARRKATTEKQGKGKKSGMFRHTTPSMVHESVIRQKEKKSYLLLSCISFFLIFALEEQAELLSLLRY